MKVQRYNVVNPKEYGEADPQTGRKKTFWANVGTLTEFHRDDGSVSRMLELNDRSEQYQVFPVEPRDGGHRETTQRPAQHAQGEDYQGSDGFEYPTEEINPDDIPF